MKMVDNKQYSITSMYTMLPWDNPYDENGLPMPHKSPKWVNSNSTNYLYDLQWNWGKSTDYEFMGNLDFDIKFTDYLTFVSINNFRWLGGRSKSYTDPRSSAFGADSKMAGRVYEYYGDTQRRYTNQMLRYNQLLGNHSINAVLGYEFNDYKFGNIAAQGLGIVPGFEILDVTTKPESVGGGISEWAVQSIIFNANYAYDNRYLAQVSFRRDGASNFGSNKKYGNFFSVSGGWNIHNEEFMKDVNWVNNLKLRASYGSNGNRPNALYPQYDLYSVSAKYNEKNGALISQIGNKDLTWEKTWTLGVGLDAVLFDRVRLTFDYYNKKTSDLLYAVPISGVVGVTSIWSNVGSVENNGVEVALGVDIVKNQDVTWSIDANLGINRNKVTELYEGKDQMTIGGGSGAAGAASRLLKPGLDADTWYIREWAGVNPENGKAMWYKTDKDGSRVKTEKYAEADEVTCGAYTPKFFGGFATDLRWRNLDFNATFGYSVGGKIYNYSRQEIDSDGTYTDRNQMVLLDSWKRWEKPGDIATHPKASLENTYSPNSNKASSRYLEEGSYLKLRSLTIGYNIPLKKWNISNLRVFLAGENLLTFTKYSGVDPEITPSGGVIGENGISSYPQVRKFMLGINITL
jgi:TonB-linked outer membrane protein, SusC/RagA family